MLVLSRKTNQRIIIGGDIEICIVAVRGGIVKVGINAPDSVSVHRKELADRMRAQGIIIPNRHGKDGAQ